MVKDQKKGFTIIEVVLVLAIAGLIFLMVFVALPALQRGQRDTQRRNDVSRFMSQISSYATNNRNSVPSFSKIPAFLRDYMKQDEGEFRDPKTGEDYVVLTGSDKTPDTGTLVYANGAKCNGEEFESISGARNVAVRIKLEGSGIYCQDNQ